MLRHLLFAIVLVLSSSLLVFSQTGAGTLKGKIIDKKTNEPIPFANIIVEIGGVQVGGSTTDMDGNYMIKPIPPGKVDLKATYVGYVTYTMKGIVVFADKIQFQNVDLQPSSVNLPDFEITDYKVPLISKDQTVSGGTVSSEDIAKMANKSAESVATTVGGVGTDANGSITSMRGQRSTGTVYYIDGIRVVGSNALPQSAIEQVEVILGGTPASYGDATGGIISVTTKGPSRDISAGIDMQTSKYLDRFGYNRVGLNLTGPVFSKKDTITKTKTPIMGYFVAGEFVYQKDGHPGAYEYWKGKDDVIDNLTTHPIRLSANGKAVELSGNYLTKNDLEQTKYSRNTSSYNVNCSGKLDFRVSPTINVSFGGTFTYNDNYGFNTQLSLYQSSLLNFSNNTHNTSSTWRVNGRFTQRFPTASDSKSFVKNVYYSIGADFSRSNGKSEDATLKQDLFKYGYIGSFATQSVRAYTAGLEKDSTSGKIAHLHNGTRDTGVVFTANNYNPASVAWVDEYYSILPKVKPNGIDGNYLTIDDIIGNNGLVNGNQPQVIYGMWASPGTKGTGYGYSENDQINVQASFAADFGHHEIQLGIQYQQRKNSAYGVDGTDMWPLMRLETNSQILELDKAHPQLVYRDGTFMDTINYYRKYSSTLQKNFDINLRTKLGLPVDGTDFIDVYSYNYDAGTINYYDKDQKKHTVHLNDNLLNVNMFTPDELFSGGSPLVSYAGYDYTGKKLSKQPTLDDFFNKQDANGNFTRGIGAFQPIYIAGYIQDKFAFKDLIFNIGLRVDRFDANQMVLKDPYLFLPAKTAGEVRGEFSTIPSNIGDNFVVYVDDPNNPKAITGYRDGNQWYNAAGTPVSDYRVVDPNGLKPYLIPGHNTLSTEVFKDYSPQVNYMPRISFSFPISDDALFYAHYDILTQRPSSGFVQIDPVAYYFISQTGSSGTKTNPALQPEKTIDYELGFQQKVNNASSLKLSMFYREMRDQIQQFRVSGAYPKTYYSYANIDFGTVKGITVAYDLRRTGNARVRFSYTLQFADGTGSDADAASTIVRSDQPNLRTMNPLNFDRRHSFNAEIDYRWGNGKDYNGPTIGRTKKKKPPVQILSNFGGNLTLTGGSGTPYTRSANVVQFGQMGPILGSVNGSRLPWQFLLNLKIDKDFNFAMGKGKKKPATINVYIEILNLLNTKNITGVYPATGSPKDDGYLAGAEFQSLINAQVNPASYRDLYSIYMDRPYNYSSPRQTRLGLMFNF